MSGVRKIASTAVQWAGVARPLERPSSTELVEAPAVHTEDIYRQAYLEGFAAGEVDGRKEAQRQAHASLKQLEQSLADAEKAKLSWQNDLQLAMDQFARVTAEQGDTIERLAADIAEVAVRRIVGQLHAERRAVEAACVETLRDLQIESAQVRVSPSDREAFGVLPPGIEVIADGSLEPGSCLLRSSRGDIDAGLRRQLTRLHDALAAALLDARQ